jgi:phosphoglycerol transferase MdoB-like AlkP superfamily enzyme
MLRGEPLALLLTVLLALLLASEHLPKVRAWRHWPIVRPHFPVLVVVLSATCAAHWFTAVSEMRLPRFIPCVVVSMALALPTAALKNERARRVVAGVTVVVASLLALADALYFRFFGGIIPLLGGANVKQAWDVTSSIVALLMVRDLAFVMLMAVGVWIASSRAAPSLPLDETVKRKWFRGVVIASTVCGLFVATDVAIWLNHTQSLKVFSWRMTLHITGLYGGHARDIARIVRASLKDGEPPSPEKMRALGKYLESGSPSVPDEFFGMARGKNLVLLQVEAMQGWVIDARVRGTEITPFLNQLARERAMYFKNLWDQTSSSPTADSEYLTLNSLHPMPDAAVVFRFSGNDFVALPGLLSRQGYSTFSAHAYERGFWNRATIHPRYGFQQSFFDRELGHSPKMGWGMSDKVFLRRGLERIDRTKAPFMAFLITLTSHHPYGYIPPEERHIDVTGLPEMLAGYVTSMRFVDEALSEFFGALGTRPYAKDTVVVIYGDHESRLLMDAPAQEQARKALSLDAQTINDLSKRSHATRKIPLLVVMPDSKQGRTFEKVGGQIDISPTLLHLFGMPKPKSMIGRPLFGTGGFVFRHDGSAIEGERLRLSDGSCRTLRGAALPAQECDGMEQRAEAQLNASWTITQYNLADKLAGPRSASR